jgi:hypothetical protein
MPLFVSHLYHLQNTYLFRSVALSHFRLQKIGTYWHLRHFKIWQVVSHLSHLQNLTSVRSGWKLKSLKHQQILTGLGWRKFEGEVGHPKITNSHLIIKQKPANILHMRL